MEGLRCLRLGELLNGETVRPMFRGLFSGS